MRPFSPCEGRLARASKGGRSLDTSNHPITQPAAGLYQRWHGQPRYRMLNLASDPAAWPALPLADLELLVFDQCLVFGAAYPGALDALERAARRDRVVRLARDRLRHAYGCYARRAPGGRRAALGATVAEAVAGGLGSAGSLLPFAAWDADAAVRAAVNA